MAMNLGDLSLEEDEEELVLNAEKKESVVEDLHLCLVGRFIKDRSIRSHIMKDRMSKVWRLVKGVMIKEATPRIFLFQFFHQLDMDKVLKGGSLDFRQSSPCP